MGDCRSYQSDTGRRRANCSDVGCSLFTAQYGLDFRTYENIDELFGDPDTSDDEEMRKTTGRTP
jgi:hypothetical protein